MGFEIPEGPAEILRTLNAAGYEAYLVGGCVRDLLRGTQPNDWDVCTSALPAQTEACFPQRHIIETGLKHGTVTVMLWGEAFEVTTYRTDGPYTDGRRPDSVTFVPELREDLARRDFTVNAMALGLDGTVRDPFGGGDDLRAGRIRCVGDPERRFREDGLRVMRALRFAATLGYHIESGTAQAIHRCRDMLRHVAAERIRVELCKLLTGSGAGEVLREYPDVLEVFWPELGPLLSLEQNNPWHCWSGWEHTLHALEAAPSKLVLRLTMLLHDVGKPQVRTTDEQGIDHFYSHAAAGEALSRAMLSRLKFDNATTARVLALVRCHDDPLPLQDRALRRWLGRLGPEGFSDLLEVHRADILAQAPDRAPERLARLDAVRALADGIIAQGQCFSLKDLAVCGRDLIGLGVPAGPEVGRLLRLLLERVMDEEVPNDRRALLQAAQAELDT